MATTRQARRQAAMPARPGASAVRLPPSRHPPACLPKPSPFPPPSTACAPASRPDCRGRLAIAYQITADRLQGQVEFAYRTDWTQVLTTLLWGGRIDDVSRRLLTSALRAAIDEACPARLPAFAAAARDLLSSSKGPRAAKALVARHKDRAHRRCSRHPTRSGLPDPFVPEPDPGPLHDELLAAIEALRNHARLRPRVTVVEGADADRSLQEALSALRSLFDAIGDYLEQVLQPLAPRIGRHALQTFIHETRHEVDELAACHTVGEGYVEALTITEPDDNTVSLEIEAWFGGAVE